MASVWLTDSRLRIALPLEEALSYSMRPPTTETETAAEKEREKEQEASDLLEAPLLPVSPLSAAAPPTPETPGRVAEVAEQPPSPPTPAPPASQLPPLSPPPPPPPLSSPPTPPPLPSPLTPLAAARSGPGLLARLAAVSAPPCVSSESSPGRWAALAPPGTRVWVLLRGKLGLKDVVVETSEKTATGVPSPSSIKTPVAWPAVLFSMARVPKADVPLLLQTFNPRASNSGRALVLFYGERSLMWSRLADLEPWHRFLGGGGNNNDNNNSNGNGNDDETAVLSRLEVLRASSSRPKVARRVALAAAEAIREARNTLGDPERELARAAAARAEGALAAANGGAAAAGAAGAGGAAAATTAPPTTTNPVPPEEGASADAPVAVAAAVDPNVYCSHPGCRETISLAEERSGSCVRCDRCGKQAHALCLDPPALKRSDLTEKFYDCPGCGAPFSPGLPPGSSSSSSSGMIVGKGGGASAATANDARHRKSRLKLRCSGRAPLTPQQEERMGLTPDRIIEGAIRVFGLEPPTEVKEEVFGPFFFLLFLSRSRKGFFFLSHFFFSLFSLSLSISHRRSPSSEGSATLPPTR